MAQICTKSFVGWGFAPDPTGGAYSAPPDPLAGLGGGAPGKGKEGGEGEKEGGDGKGGEGVPECPIQSWLAYPWYEWSIHMERIVYNSPLVCLSVAKIQKRDFLKTKQFRAMVST